MTQNIATQEEHGGDAIAKPGLPAREILKAAADLCAIGWVQGWTKLSPDDDHKMTRYCAVGAIFAAAENLGVTWDCDHRRQAQKMLRAHLGARAEGGVLENWNDAPERTQTEVVDAMRAAATMVWPPVEA